MNRFASTLKFVLVLSVVSLLFACGGTNEMNPILKKWKYQSMLLNDQELSGEQLGEPTMEFRADSTFVMEFGGVIEDGTWRIEDGILKTITSKNKDTQELLIETISDSTLVLSGLESGSNVRVVMVPVVH